MHATVLLVVLLSSAAAEQRKLWAYPTGVIVTSDGGHVSGPTETDKDKDKDKDKDAEKERERGEALKASADELTAVGKALEKKLGDCLATLRDKTPDLAKTGARYSFGLEFQIAADGTVSSLQSVKRPGSAPLPVCADQTKKQLDGHRFEPPALGTPLDARLDLEALILTDEEAKGRGYVYYEAEKAWEQAKKTHKEWFTCKKDADCAVTDEACELRGVNAAHLPDYRKAAAARQKPGCRADVDLGAYKPSCRRGLCAVRKLSASGRR